MKGKNFQPTNGESSIPNLSTYTETLNHKILITGELGVGKSAIIKRYTQDRFSTWYKASVGADFTMKTINWDAKTKVNLQLWDIPGQQRFTYVNNVFYKFADGAAIVFDISNAKSFESAETWLELIRRNSFLPDGSDIPVILLANKCDDNKPAVNGDQIATFCSRNKIDAWFVTSAKEDINITAAMEFLVGRIPKENKDVTDSFKLTDTIKESSINQAGAEISGCRMC